MAEFQEVMKQYNRMFEAHKKGVSIPVEASYETAVKQPVFFEKCVMEWAAEYPVVYPTWWEYLEKIFDPEVTKYPNDYEAFGRACERYRIPADLAEKLGIEPKEG